MQNRTDKSLFGIDINEYSQGVDFSVLATTIDFLYLRSSGSASGRFRVDKKLGAEALKPLSSLNLSNT